MRTFLIFILILCISALSCSAYGEDLRWEASETTAKTDKKIVEKTTTMAENAGPTLPVMSTLDIERQQKMLQLLRKPVVPLRSSDKIVRVLMLPYVDEHNVLHNYKYMYVKLEEGKWIVGDYLIEPARIDRRIIRPIDNPVRSAGGTEKSQQAKQSKHASTEQQNEDEDISQETRSTNPRIKQTTIAPRMQKQNTSEDLQLGQGGMSLFPEEH